MALFQFDLGIIECSLADDAHILECALPLSCGHSVCKKCVPANNNYKFKCLKCEQINQIDLSACSEILSTKTLIESSQAILNKKLSEKFKTDIEELKEKSIILENKYKAHFDYIESDIDTKIESLISDLQVLKENYNKRLNEYRGQVQRIFLEANAEIVEKEKCFKCLENEQSMSIENLYKKQAILSFIQKRSKAKVNKNILHKFDISEFEIYDFDICHLSFNQLATSVILNYYDIELLNEVCGFGKQIYFLLAYRGSNDGFTAKAFHEKCDTHVNTLTIIKDTNGNVFGGFTTQSWSCTAACEKIDNNTFIFSLKNKYNKAMKIPVQEFSVAIRCCQNTGPYFGTDLVVHDLCNVMTFSQCTLGHSFSKPFDDKHFLTGVKNFRVSEIEVFKMFQ